MPALGDNINAQIREAAASTSSPPRAERFLATLLADAPGEEGVERLLPYLARIARLFSASPFLARYATQHPDALHEALLALRDPLDRNTMIEDACEAIHTAPTPEEVMPLLRRFKLRQQLRLTIRYLERMSDIVTSMEECSWLAEACIELALGFAIRYAHRRHGPPADGTDTRICILAMGKLGGMELNYSSDVDLIACYPDQEGVTTGIELPSGLAAGQVSVHEHYCFIVETMGRVLSAKTRDGIVYRVDLRLRPQGQKGELAMSLGAYRAYYESWARTWERMAMIRLRPVAGEMRLGAEFMSMAGEFLWRRPLDYTEIEEIRSLKKKIDSIVTRDDIKRGYGGIREAEFFIQTFQLLFGGQHEALRTYRLFNAIQGLRWLRLIPEADLAALWEGYLFLRRIEHVIQMRDDLQTHALPKGEAELRALALDLGYQDPSEFDSELRMMRMRVRSMYNSLLGTEEDAHAEALELLEGGHGDETLAGHLEFLGVEDVRAGVAALKGIRERMRSPRGLGERALIRKTLPHLMDDVLRSGDPGRGLAALARLLDTVLASGAQFTALVENPQFSSSIAALLSLAPSLGRMFAGDPFYMNQLIEDMPIRRTRRASARLLGSLVSQQGGDFSRAAAMFRGLEEIRLSMFFLRGIMPAWELQRKLSETADAVLEAALEEASAGPAEGEFLVVAMGKHGGREITIGSDLDLVFVSERPDGGRIAQGIIGLLARYTDRGAPYEVDARLRPDGSKGGLVKDLEGYARYYRQKARNWEIQALLRARPVCGGPRLARAFMAMAREVIGERGAACEWREVATMRGVISRSLSKEGPGRMDIKLGPGGIEDVEFLTQWLQLRHAGPGRAGPGLAVQNTHVALRRLARAGILGPEWHLALSEAYVYYRRLETFMRINSTEALEAEGREARVAARFMDAHNPEALASAIEAHRARVLAALGSITGTGGRSNG